MRDKIKVGVERKLYAESMGRCMNPDCKEELFKVKGDIIEKAHIVPYVKTKENTYENLIVLCPNCHTNYDINEAFNEEDAKKWKQVRKQELFDFFCIKYKTFEELKKVVKPILLENQTIFNNYYKDEQRKLWDKFEWKVLSNNLILKSILIQNSDLIQFYKDTYTSNLDLVKQFILHIDEFEATRVDSEKIRQVLFPIEINSLFGIEPFLGKTFPSVESIEALIKKMIEKDQFESVVMGVDKPYIVIKEENGFEEVYLSDEPRVRQMYHDYNCFREVKVRFDSLNYALKIVKRKFKKIEFIKVDNLKEIKVNGVKIKFIYEYCLSKAQLEKLDPEDESVIANLHNWNGSSCISLEAHELAKKMNVKLLRTDELYEYFNQIK